MRNAATDLTEGTPWKIIMRFSIPLFFTFLLQQFYNMVDTIVVGQFLGKDALAGVGSTGAINFMKVCGKQHLADCFFCGDHEHHSLYFMPQRADRHEDTGRYPGSCI